MNCFVKKSGKRIYKTLRRVTVMVMAVLVCLTACESAKEREERIENENQWQEQGMKNAERYVLEKYGIQAKALDVAFDTAYPTGAVLASPRNTMSMTVRMRAGDKEFGVYINGDSEEFAHYTRDNYQREEILAAIKARASETYGEPLVFSFRVGQNLPRGDYGPEIYDTHFRTFYDGNNLQEILAENYFQIKMEYINHSFEEVVEDEFWEQFMDRAMTGIYCLSFRSEEDRQTYHTKMSNSQKYTEVEPIGLYMDYYLRDGENKERVKCYYTLCKHDGFFYTLRNMPENAVMIETADERPGVFAGKNKNGKSYYTCSPTYRVRLRDEYKDAFDSIWRYSVTVYYPGSGITVGKDYKGFKYSVEMYYDRYNRLIDFNSQTLHDAYDGKFHLYIGTSDTEVDAIEFAIATQP